MSDNKKLNLKQYRQLIYDRIKKIYRNGEEESPVPVPVPVPAQKLSVYSNNCARTSQN